jgi:hypothetical protein
MMRTSRLTTLATAFALSACSGSANNSIVVVTVTAPTNMPTVTQLRVVVSNAGRSDARLFPESPVPSGITFDTTFAVSFPTSKQGYLDVSVTALGPAQSIVGAGGASVRIVPGGRADLTVPLVLDVGPDAGQPHIDAGRLDAPTSPDGADASPDLRRVDGIGGGGAGGTTSTGGVTTTVVVGTGGVTSTGGTTAHPTGGVVGSGGATARDGGAGTGGVGARDGGRTEAGVPDVPGTGGISGIDGGGEPCVPAKTITSGGNSGQFGTAGAYCFRTSENIPQGWNCGSFDKRTVKVNGVEKTCGAWPLPPKFNGYYYFDVSAGTYDYASIYWY